jgi:hypothetical protein
MKYLLNTFRDESEATKYPNSVSILYCVNGALVFGYTYQSTIPMRLLKKHTETAKRLLGDSLEAIIKVNH